MRCLEDADEQQETLSTAENTQAQEPRTKNRRFWPGRIPSAPKTTTTARPSIQKRLYPLHKITDHKRA